jgi:hypothetical protein
LVSTADDGRLLLAEATPLDVDVVELSISFGARRTQAFAVGVQSEAELYWDS